MYQASILAGFAKETNGSPCAKTIPVKNSVICIDAVLVSSERVVTRVMNVEGNALL